MWGGLEASRASSMSDEEIVRRILDGEGALFEVLVRRYNQRLYRAIRAILPDAETEDVMQQSYINAYLHLDQFAGRAKFSTWLIRIAIHEALARARKAGREVLFDDRVETSAAVVNRPAPLVANPEHQMLTTELHALLESAVDALPPIYRMVFVLREIEGLSTAETAACLEIQEVTVKTRLLRARAGLRRHLSARFGGLSAAAYQFPATRCDRVWAHVSARIPHMTTPPAGV